MAASSREVLVRPRLPAQRVAGRMPDGRMALVPSAAPSVGGEALLEVAAPRASSWRPWSWTFNSRMADARLEVVVRPQLPVQRESGRMPDGRVAFISSAARMRVARLASMSPRRWPLDAGGSGRSGWTTLWVRRGCLRHTASSLASFEVAVR